MTVLNGLVYAVGGCDSWNCLSSVEVYDPARDTWSFVAPMSTPRRGSGVSRVNGEWGVMAEAARCFGRGQQWLRADSWSVWLISTELGSLLTVWEKTA